MHFNGRTILFAIIFGLLDCVALPIIKGVSIGWKPAFMIIPLIIYSISPFVFLKGLEQESLTILNLVWDLTSDVVITIIGLFIFSEKLNPYNLVGVGLSFIALLLMTYGH
jgi:multidrug transporter EmrE-like cation transporter